MGLKLFENWGFENQNLKVRMKNQGGEDTWPLEFAC